MSKLNFFIELITHWNFNEDDKADRTGVTRYIDYIYRSLRVLGHLVSYL